jgi:hypothetical protein
MARRAVLRIDGFAARDLLRIGGIGRGFFLLEQRDERRGQKPDAALVAHVGDRLRTRAKCIRFVLIHGRVLA